MSYLERSGDYPVIFLHGLGGSGNNWMKLATLLPDNIRMIMPDLCGHGKTSIPLSGFTIAEQVEALSEFVDRLGITRFAIVGNSYGGWVAMRFCASGGTPEYLFLLDSAGINPTVGEDLPENEEKFVERVMKMNPRNNIGFIRNFVKANASGREKVTTGELKGISARTLIIWGRRDRLIPVKYAEELHSRIHGSRLVVLEDAGHTPHATNPQEVTDLMVSFLDL